MKSGEDQMAMWDAKFLAMFDSALSTSIRAMISATCMVPPESHFVPQEHGKARLLTARHWVLSLRCRASRQAGMH